MMNFTLCTKSNMMYVGVEVALLALLGQNGRGGVQHISAILLWCGGTKARLAYMKCAML